MEAVELEEGIEVKMVIDGGSGEPLAQLVTTRIDGATTTVYYDHANFLVLLKELHTVESKMRWQLATWLQTINYGTTHLARKDAPDRSERTVCGKRTLGEWEYRPMLGEPFRVCKTCARIWTKAETVTSGEKV